jgi:hypothetical protein
MSGDKDWMEYDVKLAGTHSILLASCWEGREGYTENGFCRQLDTTKSFEDCRLLHYILT